MKKSLIVYKNKGETPLECLKRVRIEQGIDPSVPMTYAGRLDPMACGALLILVGEECKNKDEYLGFDKEYVVEILLGVETDSYDALGMIQGVSGTSPGPIDLQKYVRKFMQSYPRYSSPIIALKELPEEMPTNEVEIYSIEEIEKKEMTGEEIAMRVISEIARVTGDFRQEEIVKKWLEFKEEYRSQSFVIYTVKVVASSGTYMRSLAHDIGVEVGTGALAYSIERTQILGAVI
jgi:tRNA pseudouridine55 synthase